MLSGRLLSYLKKGKLGEMVTCCHSLSLDVPFVCLFINDLQVLRKKQNIRLHVTKIGNGKQDE